MVPDGQSGTRPDMKTQGTDPESCTVKQRHEEELRRNYLDASFTSREDGNSTETVAKAEGL